MVHLVIKFKAVSPSGETGVTLTCECAVLVADHRELEPVPHDEHVVHEHRVVERLLSHLYLL